MHLSACINTFLFNPCQLAERHHNVSVLRRCTRGWQQSARESLSEKEAFADQLHQHFLLRRSLSCWKRVCIHTHTHTIRIAVCPSSATGLEQHLLLIFSCTCTKSCFQGAQSLKKRRFNNIFSVLSSSLKLTFNCSVVDFCCYKCSKNPSISEDVLNVSA